ncbi:hypothetical protein BN1723_016126 [Verticillium longisporum]|uniref:Uncharacterized protein n=1 Tax=Verticillium longisporum TaxID=100787 RepID=A0A0G4NA14_VERLO|nr:hypothetical protein BN1723_016126 [Verticillium longisporum]
MPRTSPVLASRIFSSLMRHQRSGVLRFRCGLGAGGTAMGVAPSTGVAVPRVWERRYFSEFKGQDPVLESLGTHVGLPLTGDADKTGGLWRFDAEKAEKVRSQPPTSEEANLALAQEALGQ